MTQRARSLLLGALLSGGVYAGASMAEPKQGVKRSSPSRTTIPSRPRPSRDMTEAYARAQATVHQALRESKPTTACFLYDEARLCWDEVLVPPFQAAFPFNAFRASSTGAPIKPHEWKSTPPYDGDRVKLDAMRRRAAQLAFGRGARITPSGRAPDIALRLASQHWDWSLPNGKGGTMDPLFVPVAAALDGVSTLQAWESWAGVFVDPACVGDCPAVIKREHELLYCLVLANQDGVGAPENCRSVVMYTDAGPWVLTASNTMPPGLGGGGDETWSCEFDEAPEIALSQLQRALLSSELGMSAKIRKDRKRWHVAAVKHQLPSRILRSLAGSFRETITIRATADESDGGGTSVRLVPIVYVARGNPSYSDYRMPTDEQWKLYQNELRKVFEAAGCVTVNVAMEI
jgi:hypothetical protein